MIYADVVIMERGTHSLLRGRKAWRSLNRLYKRVEHRNKYKGHYSSIGAGVMYGSQTVTKCTREKVYSLK